jgi:hypothetical protein
MAQGSEGSRLRRAIVPLVATAAAGLAAPLLFAGPARVGVLAGVLCALSGTAAAFSLLSLASARGNKMVLGALVAAFLLRVLLVGAGLLVTRFARGDLLVFTAAFFAMYLTHQAIELSAVTRRAEGQA